MSNFWKVIHFFNERLIFEFPKLAIYQKKGERNREEERGKISQTKDFHLNVQ